MRENSPHPYVLKRLILAFVAISAVVCSFDYYYGLERINKYVLRLAYNEANTFIYNGSHFIKNGDISGLKEIATEHLLRSDFLVVELYDNKGNQLADAVKPEAKEIEEKFNKIDHGHLFKGPVKHQKLEYHDRIFLRVAASITTDGSTIGYFEGIYAVPSDDMAEIKRQALASLLKVVSIIFVTTLILYPVIISLNKQILVNSITLLNSNISTLESLGNSIAKRDSDTNDHNYRVTLYSIALSEELGFNKIFLRNMIKGAFLHDVGKIAISDTILLKPGKLTPDEFSIMKTHVDHGIEIIKDCEWLKGAGDVVEYHHEKFDGSGYPKGTKGDNIPLPARIFCIVDVFDALTSRRPYKEPLSYDKSISILINDSGSHFDPTILNAFLAISQEVYNSFGSLGEKELKHKLRARIDDIFL